MYICKKKKKGDLQTYKPSARLVSPFWDPICTFGTGKYTVRILTLFLHLSSGHVCVDVSLWLQILPLMKTLKITDEWKLASFVDFRICHFSPRPHAHATSETSSSLILCSSSPSMSGQVLFIFPLRYIDSVAFPSCDYWHHPIQLP